MPVDRGVKDGRFPPCPDKPNCVCSQASDAHYVEPLTFEGSADRAEARLDAVLRAMPRTHIVESQSGYLRAESRSRIFSFVDELEFLVDPAQSVIHVRSAARTGYSDFGVNRRRIEAIRVQFNREAANEKNPR